LGSVNGRIKVKDLREKSGKVMDGREGERK
jgi:hypothetical protein